MRPRLKFRAALEITLWTIVLCVLFLLAVSLLGCRGPEPQQETQELEGRWAPIVWDQSLHAWITTGRLGDTDWLIVMTGKCAAEIRASDSPVYCVEASYFSPKLGGREFTGPPPKPEAMMWAWAKQARRL